VTPLQRLFEADSTVVLVDFGEERVRAAGRVSAKDSLDAGEAAKRLVLEALERTPAALGAPESTIVAGDDGPAEIPTRRMPSEILTSVDIEARADGAFRATVQAEIPLYGQDQGMTSLEDLRALAAADEYRLPSVESLGLAVGEEESPPASEPSMGREPVSEPWSGLIIDARHTGLEPCMYPVVATPDGAEVYGPLVVDHLLAVNRGMAGWVTTMEQARVHPRSGSRPLIVEALSAEQGCKIILSPEDALTVLQANLTGGFLEEARVVVVVGP
jgi:hypothetical protein